MNFKEMHENYFKIFNAEQCFKGLLYSNAVDVNIHADRFPKLFIPFQVLS